MITTVNVHDPVVRYVRPIGHNDKLDFNFGEAYAGNVSFIATWEQWDALVAAVDAARRELPAVKNEPVTEHLNAIAKQAYYEVMDAETGIMGILRNRETVPDECLLALDADDIGALYDEYIGPAVDGIEDALLAAVKNRALCNVRECDDYDRGAMEPCDEHEAGA